MRAAGIVVLWALASIGALSVASFTAVVVLVVRAPKPVPRVSGPKCRSCRKPMGLVEGPRHPACAEFEAIIDALK